MFMTRNIKIAISVLCVAAIFIHAVFPDLQLDYVTLVFLLIGVLPWLSPWIKSIELPGGFKITLQDVKAATDKVAAGIEQEVRPPTPLSVDEESKIKQLWDVVDSNPNLALAGLRMEIENHLKNKAKATNILFEGRSAGIILRELANMDIVSKQTFSGLNDLIALGNQAIHGVEVTAEAARWALDYAPVILESLE